MKKKITFLTFICFIFSLSINVFAVEGKINPEWEKYMKLSAEEKATYGAIPPEYIYEYDREKRLKKFSEFNFGDTVIPGRYSLMDLDGKRYVNSIQRNQGSLGLCVAFAVYGSVESNFFIKGIENSDEVISKCVDSNPDSKYCHYKNDKELNDKYVNMESDTHAAFAERSIDYITTKPIIKVGSSERTVISEEYNPYGYRTLGDAFSEFRLQELFSYGITLKRATGIWAEYDSRYDAKTLNEVYDQIPTDYMVTNIYRFPIKPYDSVKLEAWKNELKQMIMKHGAAFIGTKGPATLYAGSCYYYDSVNKIAVINDDNKCNNSASGGHELQLIGWNDDYEYNYCRLKSSTSSSYTKESCEEAGYKWVSGKGAWLLKNSWGSSSSALYVYLTYDSFISGIGGVRSLAIKDFDNSYNKSISMVEQLDTVDKNTLLYKYYKPKKKEYVDRVNFSLNQYNGTYTLAISNDGINYKTIVSETIDYPGLRSFKLDDYALTGDSFYVKLSGASSTIDIPAVLTINECTYLNNCADEVKINSYLKNAYVNRNTGSFGARTETAGIATGEKLEYKIFNSDNLDVTEQFVIENNYVVTNSNTINISFDKKIAVGKYYLKTYYGDVVDTCTFNISNGNFVSLSVDTVFLSDKTAKVNYKILDEKNASNFRWISANETVATISDGVLTLKKAGKTTISLTVKTPDGDVTDSIDVMVYDEKISTPGEFLKIFNSSNSGKYFYITNDLDFENKNYKLNRAFTGNLNGGYHKIKNINIEENNSNGVSIISTFQGDIKNLVITDSNFKNTNGSAASLIGTLKGTSTLENVFVLNTVVTGTKNIGGIISTIDSIGTCDKCIFDGKVEALANNNEVYAGGIVGYSFIGDIMNSYNKGEITASGTNKMNVSGIMNSVNAAPIYCYNIGKISAQASSSDVEVLTAGLNAIDENAFTYNSYYLNDDSYTFVDEWSRTEEEMFKQSNYEEWDFDNVWYMDNNYPILRSFPYEITDIGLDLFSNKLNSNSEYEFNLLIVPYGDKEKVTIESLDPDLLTVKDNVLITSSKTGTARLKLSLSDKSFVKEYEIVNLIEANYSDKFTKDNVSVEFKINYYKQKMGNGYLEFKFGNDTEKIDTETTIIRKEVTENSVIPYSLKYCNDNNCSEIYSDNLNIDFIDKVRPSIKYNYDKTNESLNIILEDNESGLDDNSLFEYAVSKDQNIPSKMSTFINNKNIDIKLNYKDKYLWVKNVVDKAGNTLCDDTYCKYELNIEKGKYKVFYYDADKTTLINSVEYDEDSVIVPIKEYNKEDNEYYYELDKWNGYTDGMLATEDINLYAVYNKIAKYIETNKYQIENDYIKKINLSNIYKTYSCKTFFDNVRHNEGFLLFDGSTQLGEIDFIKTGLVYKNRFKTYKLVLTGDVTGDGYVKVNDVMKIANYLIENKGLSNEYLMAADINGDSKVKMNDLMRLATTMISGGSL